MAKAREVSSRLRSLFVERRRNLAAIAGELALLQRERLYGLLGYTSVAALAWAEYGMGKSKVSELIGIVEGGWVLPRIREAFEGGRLEWTKARELVKVATPETEEEWLEKAKGMTGEELRSERKGEEVVLRRVLGFSRENVAEFDQLVAAARRELGALDDGALVLELLRRGASREGGQGPVTRVVVTVCGECEAAHMQSREGEVVASAAVVAMGRCDGEVHDLREAENRVKRAIPEAVRRRVLDRDGRRCRVPGCRSMSDLHVHHEDGWRKGHDPERMVTVCGAHHRLRHEGELRIEGTASEGFRFLRVDGAELGGAFSHENRGGGGEGAAAFAHENRGGEGAAAAFSQANRGGEAAEVAAENRGGAAAEVSGETGPPPGPSPQDVRDAVSVLARLEVPVREARRRVQVALAGGAVGVEDLLRLSLAAG